MKRLLLIVNMILLCGLAFSAELEDSYVYIYSGSSFGGKEVVTTTIYNGSATDAEKGDFQKAVLGTLTNLYMGGKITAPADYTTCVMHVYIDDIKSSINIDIPVSPEASLGVVFESTMESNITLFDGRNAGEHFVKVCFSVSNEEEHMEDPKEGLYEASFTKIADISFTDGSSFTPGQLTVGNEAEVIGRFWMDSDISGATLTGVSIDLDGTRTGFSNIELWSSSDGSFDPVPDGLDPQLGSTIATDPGASPAVFSSLTKSISTSGDYYFLTADVDIEASGSIRAYIGEAADLTVTDGVIGETISSAPLSASEVPTSICLTSFVATLNKGKVDITWITASETENDHFLVYRDGEVIAQVEGNGTCTEPHNYTYTDAMVQTGSVYEYKISDVNLAGIETEHASVMIEIEEDVMLSDFVLGNAYPNPFNPSTVISMQYAVGSNTVVSIYNTQGILVDQLINGYVVAGNYDLTWDASGMPSGIYVVRMVAGDVMHSQKVVLMK